MRFSPKRLFSDIASESIWARGAIPTEEYKYRNLKRVWLPYFDFISIIIGAMAIAHGTRLLNELFPPALLDIMGTVYLASAMVALMGVAFPRFWFPEIIGKVVMVGMLGAYSSILWGAYFGGNFESGFVAAVLLLPLATPLFRLQMLGEEIKARRAPNESEEEA